MNRVRWRYEFTRAYSGLELVFHEKRVFELSFPVRGLYVSRKDEF